MAAVSGSRPHYSLLLITPSLLSGWVCTAGSGLVVAALIALDHVRGSDLVQLLPLWRAELSQYSYVAAFQQATGDARFQTVAATAFTFLFWAIVGLILYAVVYAVFDAVHVARQVRAEIHYVHTPRRQFTATILERAGVRLLALVCLVAGVSVMVRYGLPYILLTAQRAALTPGAVGAIVLVWAGSALLLHAGVVLLRLLLLRPRL